MAQQNSKLPIHKNFGLGASSYARSLSQPTVCANNSLPPLSPLPYNEPSMASANSSLKDATIEDIDGCSSSRGSDGVLPSKGHHRSNSDVLFGISAIFQYPLQLMPMCSQGVVGSKTYGGNCQGRNELLSSYMDLDNIESFNSSGSEDKGKDRMVRGTKINSDDTGDNAPINRHFRSVSMDSAFANLTGGDKSPKLPTSLANQVGQLSPCNSFNESSPKLNFDLRSEFSEAELKKIMADERLAKVAAIDPKQAKRILANRHSAARSKERKMRYISELEHKVHTLQTEATTLSTQVTILQKDISGLKRENKELKFRFQAMGHQAQLRDALHESLTAEVQSLKLSMGDLREEGKLSNCAPHEISQKHRMFQMQYQHSDQVQVSYYQ